MKRSKLLTAALAGLTAIAILAAGGAAETIRPVETDLYSLDNGEFRLTVRETEKIDNGGYFLAALYLPEMYETEQIDAMAAGDTVVMNGREWTAAEVIRHEDGSVEIDPEEAFDGYIAFTPADGGYAGLMNDWNPVTFQGEVRVMLPLPDRFAYISAAGGEEESADAEGFLEALRQYGDTMTAYNTTCVMEDGIPVRITHSDYPEGPSEDAEETGATPVWKFCHGRREGLETAVITGYTVDCEAGPIPVEMTEEEKEEIRRLALDGVVTGRENEESVTGGTWLYSFETPEGEYLLSIELYRGLLVATDGMYAYRMNGD